MQLVSRDVLFDVAKKQHQVQLSESESGMFQEFCRKATNEYAKASSHGNEQMDFFSNAMLRFMKDNVSQIRFVGQGSSRIVYVMANNTALKLAKTEAGIAQNRQEAKICMNPMMKYAIFPDFYGADTKNWLALNCELCAESKRSDFKRIFNAQPELIVDVFSQIDFSASNLRQYLMYLLDYYEKDDNFVKATFIKQLIHPSTEAFKALRSLIYFYADNGLNELLISDLEFIENWGLTIRNGQECLVVIDAGFNEDVYQEFYK